MKDLTIIMVADDGDYFSRFSAELRGNRSLKIRCTTAGAEALEAAGSHGVDIVVAAEAVAEGSGLDLIRQVVKTNPFVNTALVSPLPPDQFHEVTEGLGVFMQLAPHPGKDDALKFSELLTKVY